MVGAAVGAGNMPHQGETWGDYNSTPLSAARPQCENPLAPQYHTLCSQVATVHSRPSLPPLAEDPPMYLLGTLPVRVPRWSLPPQHLTWTLLPRQHTLCQQSQGVLEGRACHTHPRRWGSFNLHFTGLVVKAHTHAHVRANKHTCTHSHTHTHTQAHKHTQKNMHAHIRAHTHMHKRAQKCTRTSRVPLNTQRGRLTFLAPTHTDYFQPWPLIVFACTLDIFSWKF